MELFFCCILLKKALQQRLHAYDSIPKALNPLSHTQKKKEQLNHTDKAWFSSELPIPVCLKKTKTLLKPSSLTAAANLGFDNTPNRYFHQNPGSMTITCPRRRQNKPICQLFLSGSPPRTAHEPPRAGAGAPPGKQRRWPVIPAGISRPGAATGIRPAAPGFAGATPEPAEAPGCGHL